MTLIEKHMLEDEAWYLVSVIPGKEEKVKRNMVARLGAETFRKTISQIVNPRYETEAGKERMLFPGWLILKMRMDLPTWRIIRNTPGVTGFVGSANHPTTFYTQDWKQLPLARFSSGQIDILGSDYE